MVIIYALGAITGGFGRDFYSLIASRVLQGMGLSIVPVGLSIMSDLFPKEKIAIGQGVFSTITASGGVAGLILGGYVIQSLGWKSIFFLVAPITAIIIVLIWISIPSNKNVHDWHFTWSRCISQVYWCCYRSNNFWYVYVDKPLCYWKS